MAAFQIEVTRAEYAALVELDRQWDELSTDEGIAAYVRILGVDRTATIVAAAQNQCRVRMLVEHDPRLN